MMNNMSFHLKVSSNEIEQIKPVSGREDCPGTLIVKYRVESDKRTWLENAKTTKMLVGDIMLRKISLNILFTYRKGSSSTLQ